jgi:hypothetical protein
VTNQAGQNIGDINDLLFDKAGRISTAVIGVDVSNSAVASNTDVRTSSESLRTNQSRTEENR